jgi:citrate synthase
MDNGTMRTPPGLAGVVVADTAIGGVRGKEGFFHYRQYSAPDLAETRTLEDVWYLLHHGALPSPQQAAEFRHHLGELRALPDDLVALVGDVARVGDDILALSWVRTAVSLVAQHLGLTPWLGRPPAEVAAQATRLAAVMPTIVAAGWRARNGLAPVAPDPAASLAEDFLHMLHGVAPDPRSARAFEQYLILTIDHGFNASTFATRVVTSTGADLGAGLTAGTGALSGPLHGGAPSHCLRMLQEIGSPDRADAWVQASLARGDRIMGFGHRVYRTEDPRSAMLRGVAEGFDDPLVDLAVQVEKTILEALHAHRPERELRTNVEYYAGVVLHLVGIPETLFPACFAISRSIGWTAHMLEQMDGNRIIRPDSDYVGPQPSEAFQL